MAITWAQAKDPDEKLPYTIDWTNRLQGMTTLSAATWTLIPGDDDATLTLSSQSFDDTRATVWIEGGDEGRKYTLRCRVHTVAGWIMDESVTLTIKAK
jgi:hypothetical protein